MLHFVPALLASLTAPAQTPAEPAAPRPADPRALYDVQAYRLDLEVDPQEQRLSGLTSVEARVSGETLDELVLDLQPAITVEAAFAVERALDSPELPAGPPLEFTREPRLVRIRLAQPAPRGATVRVGLRTTGQPKAVDGFDGFHWVKTPDGRPWVNTSSQGTGASAWWPCKDSFFHPEEWDPLESTCRHASLSIL